MYKLLYVMIFTTTILMALHLSYVIFLCTKLAWLHIIYHQHLLVSS